MDRTILLKTLVDVLHSSVSKQIGDIDENTRLKEDLNLDSLDLVAVAVEIQCELDVELTNEEFPGVVKVKDLLDLIGAKLQNKYNSAA